MAANIIIIALLAVACLFAARGAYRHLSGKGACCGGGGADLPREADKKLGGKIVEKKNIKIEGMTCENCANKVKHAINSVDGASGKVNLRKGTAVVSCDREVDDLQIKRAIERAGYTVKAVS